MSGAKFLVGDVFARLADIPDASIDCIVTSPPFLALRSYLPAGHPDKSKEIGSEATPAAFLSTLLALTREWRRVLAPHGSICVELGDTYSGANGWGDDAGNMRYPQGRSRGAHTQPTGKGWPLAKSLTGIPTLYAWSLAYGRNLLDPDDTLDPWRIRNLIAWHRPNPPVGALGDKVRPSTSYVTVACTSPKRWFDLDAERTEHKGGPHAVGSAMVGGQPRGETSGMSNPAGAPPLDTWIIPTQPYSGAHYATFPIALPRKLINLMCPRSVCVECGEPRRRVVGDAEYVSLRGATSRAMSEGRRRGENVNQWTAPDGTNGSGWGRRADTLGWTDCGHDNWRRGIVLDPFAGSGTTLVAASELGRDSIGIDLDERNVDLARERCGLFLEIPT